MGSLPMGRLPPSLNISPTADLIPSKLWDYTPAYYISMIAEFQVKRMRIAKVDFWALPMGRLMGRHGEATSPLKHLGNG
jgi:hypothetical protein